MKKRFSIIFAAAMALAAVACTKYIYVYTVGELDNPITLMVGMANTSSAQTKAGEEPNPDAGAQYDHEKHLGFTAESEIRLKVDGTWTGHDPVLVSKTTVATLAAQSGNHNSVASYNPVLYWDDYGTADPANKETGRAQGLTIYGVAVNDKDADVPDVDGTSGKQWTALNWTLPDNQSEVGEGTLPWTRYDLLISNNVRKISEENDNRYKFDYPIRGSKLLEFTHAMSKITVEVKPDDTFGVDGFKNIPAVEFKTGFKMTGTVNIETGAVSATGGASEVGSFKLKQFEKVDKTYKYNGLVMPGNTLSDNAEFIEVNADGNIYKVSTHNLFTKMSQTPHNDPSFKSGKNYVVTIQLGKTEINVTATIVDWVDVVAPTSNPAINVSANIGTGEPSTLTEDTSFSFFIRKHEKEAEEVADLYGNLHSESDYYDEDDVLLFKKKEAEVEVNKWGLVHGLYWPDHNTHLHMRGVYPQVGAPVTPPTVQNVPVVTGTEFQNQSIAVFNAAYAAKTFPSDLMLGKPEVGDATCPSNSHTPVLMKDHGICATTGRINLTFKYMMSQVEVRLKTAVPITHDAATPADAVDLTNAEVAVIGIQSSGSVTLDDIVMTPSGDRTTKESPYVIPPVASGDPRDYIPTANIRHAAIVPQSLIYNTNQDAQFKITLKTGDAHDVPAAVYYVKIRDLMHGLVPATPENKWEAGRHYIYTFDLRRTGVEVTATIVPWVEAEAESDVWM